MRTSPPLLQQEDNILYSEEDAYIGVVAESSSGIDEGGSSSSVSTTQILSDRASKHPVEAMIESRSWMADDVNSFGDRTDGDDDEFRKELERLNLSEEEVNREIREAMELFQQATEKKELSEREASLIRMSYLDMIENGTRDSSSSSFPSDEACNSGPDDEREPRDEGRRSRVHHQHNLPTAGLSLDSTETSSGMHFESYEDPTAELLTIDDQGSLKPNSPEPNSSEQQTSPLEITNEKFEAVPDKAQRSTETPDAGVTIHKWETTLELGLEQGKKDIFEEERFWDDGLWKTPIVDQAKKNSSHHEHNSIEQHVEDQVQYAMEDSNHVIKEEFLDEYEASNHTRTIENHKKYAVLEQLFLPDLRSPAEENDGVVRPENVSISNSKHSEKDDLSAFREDFEPAYWDARRENHEILETHFAKPVRNVSRSNSQQHERAGSVDRQRKPTSCWCCRLWIILVGLVHVLLVVGGFVVLSKFLVSRRSTTKTVHPEAVNNQCITAEFLGEGGRESIVGTFYGVVNRKEVVACQAGEVAGLWYSTVGTGKQIVANVISKELQSVSVQVLSGPCSNPDCVGTSLLQMGEDGTSSVVWPSHAGELYHIFVHGEGFGSFSLSLGELPTFNVDCDGATSVILPQQRNDVMVSSRTSRFASEYPCEATGVISFGSWFSIPGNGKYIEVSLCDEGSLSAESTHIQVVNGDCNYGQCALADPDVFFETKTSRQIGWLSEPSKTYYIFVWSSESETVAFDLCFTQHETGKSCQSSIEIASFQNDHGHMGISGYLSIEDDHIQADVNGLSTLNCHGTSTGGPLEWYILEGNGEAITATTCGDESNNLTAVFDVFMGTDCTNLQCVQDGTSGSCGASGQQFLNWPTIPGQLYWISVYAENPEETGSFTLDLMNFHQNESDDRRKLLRFGSKHSQRKFDWVDIVGMSLCSLFAQFAWRWRRLKPFGEGKS